MKESLDREARERGIPVAKLLEGILAERYCEQPSDSIDIEPESDSEPESKYTPGQLDILDELDLHCAGLACPIRGELDARAIGPGTVPDSS
jgi:hypothetical protein